jgi:hypothetical protein
MTSCKFRNWGKEVKDMVLIMMTMWYPLTKMAEVTKKYFEVMKKFPFASFEKPLVNAIKMHDKEGSVIIMIVAVDKGKYEESLNLIFKRFLECYGIEGLNYKVETLMTFEENFALRGIVPPK